METVNELVKGEPIEEFSLSVIVPKSAGETEKDNNFIFKITF